MYVACHLIISPSLYRPYYIDLIIIISPRQARAERKKRGFPVMDIPAGVGLNEHYARDPHKRANLLDPTHRARERDGEHRKFAFLPVGYTSSL